MIKSKKTFGKLLSIIFMTLLLTNTTVYANETDVDSNAENEISTFENADLSSDYFSDNSISLLGVYYDVHSDCLSIGANINDAVIFLYVSGWLDYGYSYNRYSYVDDGNISLDDYYTDSDMSCRINYREDCGIKIYDNYCEKYYDVIICGQYEGTLRIRLQVSRTGELSFSCGWY